MSANRWISWWPTTRYGTRDISRFIPTAGAELHDAGVRWTGDIREIHGSYLGKSCRDLITAIRPLELAPADEAFVSRFLSRESRVAAMSLCYVGDSGNAAPQYLLSSRTRMIDAEFDEDRYEKLSARTDSFWGFRRATIGKGAFSGGHFSLDTRRRVPPFSPRTGGVAGAVCRGGVTGGRASGGGCGSVRGDSGWWCAHQ